MSAAFVVSEFHPFEAAGRQFLYLVPSAAIVEVNECARRVLESLAEGPRDFAGVSRDLQPTFGAAAVAEAFEELGRVRAITPAAAPASRPPRLLPLTPVPVETLVVNVTSRCNLACTYCYEYGDDRVVDGEGAQQPAFMNEATARASIDLALRESGANPRVQVTFFGGETLLNFPVLRLAVAYGQARAREVGKAIGFGLTTNATVLTPDIIEFLAANRIGVTVSIDGPKELQDKFRVFKSGRGSYEAAVPKIKALLARHRTAPVAARVTLTRQTLDVCRVYRHLTEDVGFREVGFAPASVAAHRDYAIGGDGLDCLLSQFRELANEYREAALANRHHGFSNVRETLQEIHAGHAKAYPCGAGVGLLGVATGGDVALCHRFAGSRAHRFGSVHEGIDRGRQQEFLAAHHIDIKTDCRRCWARPICAGGCYHEAHTRYGATDRPNLHYCEWIRGWTHTCLEIYGQLAIGNPAFLRQLERPASEAAT